MTETTIITTVVALLAVSEALAHIPKVRANGVFQLIWNVLKMFAGKKK